MYRHGDRSPMGTKVPIPNDPYDEATWPQGWGQLSSIGIMQQYQLGQWLQRKYDGFFNKTYINKEIYVRSTDKDRTLMSAYSNLAGFFPSTKSQPWSDGIAWQPIPVHTVPQDDDELLAGNCPKMKILRNKLQQSKEYAQLQVKYQDLFSELKRTSGAVVDGFPLGSVADRLFCEKQHNFDQNAYMNDELYKKIRAANEVFYNFEWSLPELVRLKTGLLLGELINHMKGFRDGTLTPLRKMFMYSVHDSNITPFLRILRNEVFFDPIPTYTQCIMVELHQSSSAQFFVKVFLRNSTDYSREAGSYLHDLTPFLPGCSKTCSLDTFIDTHSALIPKNIKAECQTETARSENAKDNYLTIAVVVVVIFVLIIVLVSAFVCINSYKKRQLNRIQRYRMLSNDLHNEEEESDGFAAEVVISQ